MKIRRMSLGAALIGFVACTFQTSVAQRASGRVIHRLPVEENEPIAITDTRVNDQSVAFDQVFTADDEWLKTLTISVRNESNKVILYAAIDLQFPRPSGSQDRIAIFDVFYGSRALQTRRPTSKEILVGISPGETVEIRLSPQQFANLREFLTATKYSSIIENVSVSIGHVIFQDDTMWYAGATLLRDPKEPGSWINSQLNNSKPQ